MGIRGLHTYICEHASKTLEWHRLHDRNLIIDGNNLAHFLYAECSGINAYFGGDYDKYANFVQKFFEGLQQCNVKCIVVLDGGQPMDGRKLMTVRTRLQMQLSMCLRASPAMANFKIFPPMGRQVFVTTLRSMDITVLQTDFEADQEIAVLAKNLGYTVLSNDSDFIVCEVPLIRLESINYKNICTGTDKATGETYSYIPCFLFNREKFCTMSNINREHMPLFGTLLSNDYIPLSEFANFYLHLESEVQQPSHRHGHGHGKRRKGKYREITEGHKRIKNLLLYLSRNSKKSVQEIVKKVISQYCNPRLRKPMLTCIDDYANLDARKSNLFSALPESVIDEAPLSEAEKSALKATGGKKGKRMQTALLLKTGNRPPNWFVEAYRTHRISHEVSDILTKGYFISPPQVEMKSQQSSYLVAEPIVRSVYTVLWKGLRWNEQVLQDTYESEEDLSDFDDCIQFLDISQDGADDTLLDSDGEGNDVASVEKEEEGSEINIEEKEENDMASDGEEKEENDMASDGEEKEESEMVNEEEEKEEDENISEDEQKEERREKIAEEEEEEESNMGSEEVKSFPIQQNITSAQGDEGGQNRGIKRGNQNFQKWNRNKKKKKQSAQEQTYRPPFRKHLRWFIRKYDRLWIKDLYFLDKQQANLLPSLDDVEKMSLHDKKIVFYRMLNLKASFQQLDLPDDLELILDFILYWFENSSTELADIHAISALVCVFQYYIIDGKNGRVRTKKKFAEAPAAQEKVSKMLKDSVYASRKATFSSLVYNMSHEECLVAGSNLFSYHHRKENFNVNDFNITTVHSFSEFQVCVYFLQLVNSLLCFPFPLLSIEFLWGGTFSYNIFHHIKKCGDPLLWVRKSLGMGTCLERLFVKLYDEFRKRHALPILRGKKRKESKGVKKKRGIDLKEENILVAAKETKNDNPLCQVDDRFDGLEIDWG